MIAPLNHSLSVVVTPLPANTREAPLKSAVVATFSGSNSAPAGVEVTATVSSTINVAEPVAAPTQFPATAQVLFIPPSYPMTPASFTRLELFQKNELINKALNHQCPAFCSHFLNFVSYHQWYASFN